ncbi:MAG: phosphoribosyltransferase [Methanosarcinales archaeon]|nr:phosphoribosyltransferase [Methanosarcinales archaeon]
MSQESFRCTLVSWEEATRLSRVLAARIRSSRFRPHLVIAIGRGGFVPARVVCDSLLLSNLTSIKVEHWGVAARQMQEARVKYPLPVDVRGLKLLIVDDVTDTGETLKATMEHVGLQGPQEVRTAVLQHKTCSQFVPDYYAEAITEWRWIIYPWAAHEDLVGFTEKVLAGEALGVPEIRAGLERRYSLQVSEKTLAGVLAELMEMGRLVKVDGLYSLVSGPEKPPI